SLRCFRGCSFGSGSVAATAATGTDVAAGGGFTGAVRVRAQFALRSVAVEGHLLLRQIAALPRRDTGAPRKENASPEEQDKNAWSTSLHRHSVSRCTHRVPHSHGARRRSTKHRGVSACSRKRLMIERRF